MSSRVVLLNSQEVEPTAAAALLTLGIEGPVGLITAGWQEWEGEHSRIEADLAARTTPLSLYGAAERVWREDPELATGHKATQRAIRTARRAYNVRLAHMMRALEVIKSLDGDSEMLEAEAAAAFEGVRSLDLEHSERVGALRSQYEERFNPMDRPAVRREREDLKSLFAPLEAVVVEGGHIAVLLNRMRLFGVAELMAGKTILACSGGAMVLSSRVVLFHDSPPQGRGHPELSEAGLGLFPDVVALAHAESRLLLDDTERVSRFARRFGPGPCVPLDPGAWIEWGSSGWTTKHARRLTPNGTVEPWEVAA
jgi:hypothetical protein